MTEQGHTSRSIAQEIGCHHSSVQDAQRDVFAEAKEIIRSAMPRLANTVARTKNPTVALKVLQAHEVVPREEVSSGLTVQIGINLADLTPCIDAQVQSAQTVTEHESDK